MPRPPLQWTGSRSRSLPTLEHPLPPGLREQVLWREGLRVVVPVDHALGALSSLDTPALSTLPLVVTGASGSGRPDVIELLGAGGVTVASYTAVDTVPALLALVRAGSWCRRARIACRRKRCDSRPGGPRRGGLRPRSRDRRLLVSRSRRSPTSAVHCTTLCSAQHFRRASRPRVPPEGWSGGRRSATVVSGVPRRGRQRGARRRPEQRRSPWSRSSVGSPSSPLLRARLADARRGQPRRSCRSRGRPGSGRPRCSSISSGDPGTPGRPSWSGQRRGDRGAARLRGRRAARALGRPGRGHSAPGSHGSDPDPVGRHPFAGASRPAGSRIRGRARRRRRPLGGSPVAAGADLRAAPARRRPACSPSLARARRRARRICPRACAGWSAGTRAACCGCVGSTSRTCTTWPRAWAFERFGSHAARRLRYGTQGNPLHARALLEEFPPSRVGRRTADDDRPLPPPRSFRRLVQDRYAACSAAAQRLVDAAAVLGPHCPLPLAAALADVAEPLPALDEAVTLRPAGGGPAGHPVAAVVPASAGPRRGVRRDAARPAPRPAPRRARAGRRRGDRAAAPGGRGHGARRRTRRRSDPVRRRGGRAGRRGAAAQRISSTRAD